MSIDAVSGNADLSAVQGQEAPVTDSLGDTDAVVQPQEQAQADDVQANAPESDDDTGYGTLPEEERKRVDAVITRMRQKDARERELNEARYNWARQIQELSQSDDPQKKAVAAKQLRHVADLIYQEEQRQEAPADPFAEVDWESVDIVAPGLGRAVQLMREQLSQMQQSVEHTTTFTRQSQMQAAKAQLEKELADTKAWAESNGLPFDAKRVLEADVKHNLRDAKAAYHVAYRDEILEAAKAAERKRLEARKATTLPSPNGGFTPSTSGPPKTGDIHELYRWVKSQQ